MEKLQYRALRLVFNDFESSYETLLERVNVPSLHVSRIRLIATESFKILHKMTPVYLEDLLSYKNSAYSVRYDNLVDVPRVRTTKYDKSTFRYEAAGMWNSLPNELRKVQEASRHMGRCCVQMFIMQKSISFNFCFSFCSV